MASRRDFLKNISIGAASGLALTTLATARPTASSGTAPLLDDPPQTLPPYDTGTGTTVRIGIIGAENSHSRGFGRVFNIDKKFPGVEVVAIWGETDAFAKNSAEKGHIPHIVKHQEDLLGMIDALIIDHRHAKYHVAAAIPFIEAGIPVFMDKPFSYRYAEGRDLLEMARRYDTPITSFSTAAWGPEIDDMAAQVRALPDVLAIVTVGACDIHSKYGGVFFYGIHTVERLFKIFGDDVEAVRATRHGTRTTVQFKFSDGRLATTILEPKFEPGWETWCLTPEGFVSIQTRVDVENSLYCYADIVRMFQTGHEPRAHTQILQAIAALEAIEQSLSDEQWQHLPL